MSFTRDFLQSLHYAETREDAHALLQAVIEYYSVPENEKEHPLLAILSIVYRHCPDAFFLYVLDFDAKERDFILLVKVMFERGDISNQKMNEWEQRVKSNLIPLKVKIS